MNLYNVHLWDKDLKEDRHVFIPANTEDEAEQNALDNDYLACAEADGNVYKLLGENNKYKYYVSDKGCLVKTSKNTYVELGYIEDNIQLYKKLCESV